MKFIKKGLITLATLLALTTGCSRQGGPERFRFGCLASPTAGTEYLGTEDDLGIHNTPSEKTGIVYTNKGGHIDLHHLRDTADWTKILRDKSYEKISNNQTDLSFNFEYSKFNVKLNYPKNWNSLDKEQVTKEISIEIGSYLAHQTGIWHEILTWFGSKPTTWILPEFQSAFSWEDSYSDNLGCYIAAKALKEDKPFRQAMTSALERELEVLEIQPKQIAKRVAESMRGDWYKGVLFVNFEMRKRNIDIGIDDGYVSPILPENTIPKSYPAQGLEGLSKYGFSLDIKFEPRVLEKNKVLDIIYPKEQRKAYLIPNTHLPIIMEYIKKQAEILYGPEACKS